jgi:hypothetical protein
MGGVNDGRITDVEPQVTRNAKLNEEMDTGSKIFFSFPYCISGRSIWISQRIQRITPRLVEYEGFFNVAP